MSHPPLPGAQPSRPPLVTWRRALAACCVLLPLVLGPWVSLYNRRTPTLAGIPFFYWSQLAWIVVAGALCALAAQLLAHEPAGKREVTR